MQLLQKLNITAVGKREKLLRVIKNPVTKYFPVNSRKIGGFDFCYCFSLFCQYKPVVSRTQVIFLLHQVSHIAQRNWLK